MSQNTFRIFNEQNFQWRRNASPWWQFRKEYNVNSSDPKPFPILVGAWIRNRLNLSWIRISMLLLCTYHLPIAAIGPGLLKNFYPMAIGCVLCPAGSFLIWNMNCRPTYFVKTQFLPHPGHDWWQVLHIMSYLSK